MKSLGKEKQFIYDSYMYSYLLIKEDRKTIRLTVTPDPQIILRCPIDASEEKIEKFLKRKWLWMEKQLGFFKKYKKNIYEKEYVTGESFLYKGRQYKLVVKDGPTDNVLLSKGILEVFTSKGISEKMYVKYLLDKWYLEKTKEYFEKRYEEVKYLFDYKKFPKLLVRVMKKRWGSFISKEKILLNPKLIHTPKECIDYVIVHELCHIKYKDHSTRFWKLLSEKYPNWERVKEKLETIGSRA